MCIRGRVEGDDRARRAGYAGVVPEGIDDHLVLERRPTRGPPAEHRPTAHRRVRREERAHDPRLAPGIEGVDARLRFWRQRLERRLARPDPVHHVLAADAQLEGLDLGVERARPAAAADREDLRRAQVEEPTGRHDRGDEDVEGDDPWPPLDDPADLLSVVRDAHRTDVRTIAPWGTAPTNQGRGRVGTRGEPPGFLQVSNRSTRTEKLVSARRVSSR